MKQYKLFALAFLTLLLLPAAWLLFGPQREFSENENRYLAQAPELRAESFRKGEAQSELETWMADQFPGRDLLTGAATAVKKAAGYRQIGGAYLGKDGYYPEAHEPESFSLTKYRRNLGYLAETAKQAGVPATALLIPCAASARPELLPAGGLSYDPELALQVAREVMPEVGLPDLTAALRAAGDEQLFYRTDHHWTAAGAAAGYACLTGGNGNRAPERTVFCEDFYGTTWSKTLDPFAKPDRVELFSLPKGVTATADGEPIPVYDLTAKDRKDKYTVYLGGNHGLVTLTGGCSNGKTLLVLKDSFANCLAPLLTADYETVILVDLRYYAGSVRSLIARTGPDELLFVYEMSGVASGDDIVKLLL